MDVFDALLPTARVTEALADDGYVHVHARDFRALAGMQDAAAFASFAALWENMPLDEHMADGGRYRRRLYAAFDARGRELVRKPHQPHFQSKAYNPLNGDRQRWFEPARDALVNHPITQGLFSLCTPLFSSLEGGDPARRWDVELHQFRIEARGDGLGLPTPEGMHRDGVDWVLVMLIGRSNVDAGTTQILDEEGRRDSFTLTEPGEAVLLDDRRIRHGVTAIRALDPALPAYRDVLVVTWRAAAL